MMLLVGKKMYAFAVYILVALSLFAEGEPKRSTLKLDGKGQGDECHACGAYNTDAGHEIMLVQLVNQMARMV